MLILLFEPSSVAKENPTGLSMGSNYNAIEMGNVFT